jgi:DNA gyrase subunit B
VIFIRGQSEDVQYEVAFQYANEYTENLNSYVNNVNTPDGGTHVSGFRTALTRTLNAYGKKEDMFKDVTPSGEDFREGLTVIVSVKVPEPKFHGQTKTRLLNAIRRSCRCAVRSSTPINRARTKSLKTTKCKA